MHDLRVVAESLPIAPNPPGRVVPHPFARRENCRRPASVWLADRTGRSPVFKAGAVQSRRRLALPGVATPHNMRRCVAGGDVNWIDQLTKGMPPFRWTVLAHSAGSCVCLVMRQEQGIVAFTGVASLPGGRH